VKIGGAEYWISIERDQYQLTKKRRGSAIVGCVLHVMRQAYGLI
jgi:hypothetical protein